MNEERWALVEVTARRLAQAASKQDAKYAKKLLDKLNVLSVSHLLKVDPWLYEKMAKMACQRVRAKLTPTNGIDPWLYIARRDVAENARESHNFGVVVEKYGDWTWGEDVASCSVSLNNPGYGQPLKVTYNVYFTPGTSAVEYTNAH